MGQLGQPFIGPFFFSQRLAEKVFYVLTAQNASPGRGAAVTGDLVMLDLLRSHDDRRIQGFRSAFVFHHFLGFIENAGHAFALGAFGGFTEHLKDLFEAVDMSFGLLQVLRDRIFQLRGGGLFRDVRQSFD